MPLPAAEPTPSERSPARIRGLSANARIRVWKYEGAELSRILGGVRERGTILLAGEAGAGKSTAAAELAANVTREKAHREVGREARRQASQRIHELGEEGRRGAAAAGEQPCESEEGATPGRRRRWGEAEPRVDESSAFVPQRITFMA